MLPSDPDDTPILLRLAGWGEAFMSALLGGLFLLAALAATFGLAGAIGGLGGMIFFEMRRLGVDGLPQLLLLAGWILLSLLPIVSLLRALWGVAR